MALVFFGGVKPHVDTARELHKELANNRGIQVRAGLHSGPVHRVTDINGSPNVSGNGINFAQRVMDCGDAGHILLSRTVATTLSELGDFECTLKDLGMVEVKHGVQIQVFNLLGEGFGNVDTPSKLAQAAIHEIPVRANASRETVEETLVVPSHRRNQMTSSGKPSKTVKELQLAYWSELNGRLRQRSSVVRLCTARSMFSISGPLAHRRVQIFASMHIGRKSICAGVRLLNRRDLYDALNIERKDIEDEIARGTGVGLLDITWSPHKKYQTVSEILVCLYAPTLNDPFSWNECLEWHEQTLESLYRAFSRRIREFEHSHGADASTGRSSSNERRLVEEFWKGFQVRIRNDNELSLNNPSFSTNPSSKSSMSKTHHGVRLAAQIHPSKQSADVNLTGGRSQHIIMAKLHKRRASINQQFPNELEWMLNTDGESWVLIRRPFQIFRREEWEATYNWLHQNLKLFLSELFPRIEAIKRRLEKV